GVQAKFPLRRLLLLRACDAQRADKAVAEKVRGQKPPNGALARATFPPHPEALASAASDCRPSAGGRTKTQGPNAAEERNEARHGPLWPRDRIAASTRLESAMMYHLNPENSEQAKLPARIMEVLLPTERCDRPACRRLGRCCSETPIAPPCLARLDTPMRKSYDRLLETCVRYEQCKLDIIFNTNAALSNAFLVLAFELVRRVQPRGHWLHAALPRWYRIEGRRVPRPDLQAALDAWKRL
ncbi:MAG TPA: hypothetical protein VL202_18845, partial [Pararhizobium sp.]|uniref:hypothetical protein n=1 Tax=Pararhizobium sp. TaxID=1977563 RepID=UPI002B8442FA